jgi:hypothetical protein
VHYEIPRVACVWMALAAAALFLMRARRRIAAGLGIAAAVAALTPSLATEWGWWSRFGPFGDDGARATLGLAWSVATLAVLLLVPRSPGSSAHLPVRASALGVARFVPAWLAAASALAMLHLAYAKIRTMVPVKCPDPWLDANLLMTTGELWTGLLILLPSTRREGLRFGMLLMEGTCVYAARLWLTGASSRGCGCFGGIEVPWSAHAAIAAGLAFMMGAARARELKLHAASRCARAAHSGVRSRFPAALVWCRAFRRAHRASGAHRAWAAPAAAAVLGVVAVPVFAHSFDGIVMEIGGEPAPGVGRLTLLAVCGVAPLAAAWHFARPDWRARVLDPFAGRWNRIVRGWTAVLSASRAAILESNRGRGAGPRPR